jgi:hypothetical protein
VLEGAFKLATLAGDHNVTLVDHNRDCAKGLVSTVLSRTSKYGRLPSSGMLM